MLALFSGPSGAGKSFAVEMAVSRLGAHRVVPWTSRPARVGELNGVEYNFATRREIEAASDDLKRGYWVSPYDDGTLYGYLDDIDASVRSSELYVAQAAAEIGIRLKGRHAKSHLLLLMMCFATPVEFERRLMQRIPDPEDRAKRRNLATGEISRSAEYDHLVEADLAAENVEQVISLVKKWQARTP